MKSSVQPVEGTENAKVKVVVEVDEVELEEAIDHAWGHVAKEVRMPGFRPGKAPKRLLEQRLGKAYGRSEALREFLPIWYSRAVNELEVDVIDAPEIDITDGRDEGPLTFEATVEVRPEITLGGYNGLRIEIAGPEPSDDDIDAQVDRLRGNYAELVVVERAAAAGDYVTIDIAGTQDGEALDGLTADGYLYEVGSGTIVEEFDTHLTGTEAGASLTFEAAHPDPDEAAITFAVSVTEVKERVLPELTDAWVADATEFESVAELRRDLRERLTESRTNAARNQVRVRIQEALAELVGDDIPEAMVNNEMSNRVENLARQIESTGLSLEQYLEATGQAVEDFREQLREAAVGGVKVDLALRAVAVAQDLTADDEALAEEIASIAAQAGIDVDNAREQLTRAGQIAAVRSDLTKRRALEWLVEHSEVVDEDGNPVDRELLKFPDADTEPENDES